MSWQAELVRLGLRFLLKPSTDPSEPIERIRARIAGFERWTPQPPHGVETARREVAGMPALCLVGAESRSERHILYLHGGGYVTASPELYRPLLWRLAAAAKARVVAIDYRLAPEHPFPAALDDAVAAWRGLLAAGAEPGRTAVVGDSAGGGLVLALALRLRDERGKLPAALVALSPWTDLALSGRSLGHNADPMQGAGLAARFARLYLNGADPRQPYASPLYSDPAGLPPTLIQAGSDEMLRDDAVRMADRMRQCGCAVDLEIWPRMPHVWQIFAAVMPEARQAIARIGAFIEERIGGTGSR